MTPSEEKIMGEHFEYLKDLTAKNQVILAGPCFGLKIGIIILQVESEAEARAIMAKEPSVVQGVHKFEIYPMVVSLLTEYQSPNRYPKEVSDKVLQKEIIIKAKLEDVWNAWTTTEGVKSFFSENALVELRVGGPFEIYFLMDRPYGERGSEGCRILSYFPMEMLSFDWNAPPQFGELRTQHTQVILKFTPLDDNKIRINFYQHGWGKGANWDELYAYFDKAWDRVLENLRKRFE